MKSKKLKISVVVFFIGCVVLHAVGRAGERPLMHAVRVRDGGIVLDGRADDWSFAFPAQGYVMGAADRSHFDPEFTKGIWTGPDDLSYRMMAATDSKYLYIIGFVRDSFLFNGGDQESPKAAWRGDDFEVYVDANSPEGRFQKSLNGNCEQFIFVPEHLWSGEKGTPVWGAAKVEGVRAVSRLTPTGYVMEVAIPKALFPNWKAHPDMDSIGFDMMVGDIDTPGVIGHDPGQKQMMFLLDAHPHFESPAGLGSLQFDQKLAAAGKRPATTDAALPGYAKAQAVLDHWNSPGVEKEANAALKGPALAQKAAALLFYKRPELSPDVGALVDVLKEKPGSTESPMLDGRPYAMLALAGRHQLPAADLFDAYGPNDDPVLSQAFLYSLGLNGDNSIVPRLAKLYPATKGSTQDIIAFSLGELGDKTGVPSLEVYGFGDAGPAQPFAIKCKAMLEALGVPKPH